MSLKRFFTSSSTFIQLYWGFIQHSFVSSFTQPTKLLRLPPTVPPILTPVVQLQMVPLLLNLLLHDRLWYLELSNTSGSRKSTKVRRINGISFQIIRMYLRSCSCFHKSVLMKNRMSLLMSTHTRVIRLARYCCSRRCFVLSIIDHTVSRALNTSSAWLIWQLTTAHYQQFREHY